MPRAQAEERDERNAADAYLDRLGIPDRPDTGGVVWVTPPLLEQVLPELGLEVLSRSGGGAEVVLLAELDGFAVEAVLRGGPAEARGPVLAARASFVLDGGMGLAWTNAWNARGNLCTAHLDADGDPVLQAVLDTGGGVTLEGLRRFLRVFVTEVREFVASL